MHAIAGAHPFGAGAGRGDDVEPVAPRIWLRPIGSPLPVGMSGLTIASLVQSGFDLGWVPRSAATEVGVILVAVPFILQLVATVCAYLARDGAMGACTGVLSTSWLALGVLHIVASRPTSSALGLMMLASAATVALSAVAVWTTKPLPAGVFLLTSLRFAVAGVYELSGATAWVRAAGAIGLAVTAAAAYCVLAFELEGARGAPVLPTMRRSRAGRSDGVAAQLDGLAHEAGVRRASY